MARLIMRVADSIFAGTPGGGRGVPLAELCSVLLLAEADERKATPQPPQNPSAQPGTGVSAEFNTEASGDLTAERFPENVHRECPETRRAVPPLLQSPIARLCLAATVVAAASVSVLGVLALRPTAEILSVADAFPNPADPGLTRASVPGPDPSTGIVAVLRDVSPHPRGAAPDPDHGRDARGRGEATTLARTCRAGRRQVSRASNDPGLARPEATALRDRPPPPGALSKRRASRTSWSPS